MDTSTAPTSNLAVFIEPVLGDTFIWAVQWCLGIGLVVATAAAAICFRTGRIDPHRIPAVTALSPPMIVMLGAAHVAGGIGLVLPQLTGVVPWLTPWAALGLALQASMAAGFHLRAGEEALEPALWGLLFGAVAFARLDLLGVGMPVPDAVIGTVIAVLLIALAINLVVLLRGARNPLRAAAVDDGQTSP